MTKVLILQDPPGSRFNFLPAEKFGEIHIMFPYSINALQIKRHIPEIREKIRALKANKNDYFLPIGNPAMMAVAGHIWLDMFGEMKLLNWDRQMGEYYEVEVSVI